MKSVKTDCPVCGAQHSFSVPLVAAFTCGTCRTTFSPMREIRRYAVHVCRPGSADSILDSHYSSRPFMLPRPGDVIVSPFIDLKEGQQLRVTAVQFELASHSAAGRSDTLQQVVRVLTEVSGARSPATRRITLKRRPEGG